MLTRGYAAKIPFSSAEGQEEGLKAYHCPVVYIEGRGAETLGECLKSYRSDVGELWVFGGYRVFGGSRAAIMAAVKDIKHRGFVIVDMMNNERSDKHDSEMLDRALRQILGANKNRRGKQYAKRVGRLGGLGKAKHQAAKRAEKMPDNAVMRLIGKIGKMLTWRDVEEVTTISTATLRRHYK